MFRPLTPWLLLLLVWPARVQADPPPQRLVVATWNVEWFFDEHTGDNFQDLPKRQAAPSRADWDWKLAGVAEVIARIKPTILALQEVENRRVLFYLTQKLKRDHGLDYQVAFIEGDDYFTEQDVAVLAQSGLVEFAFRRQTQEMFDSRQFYNVTKHVLCTFEWSSGSQRLGLTLVNLHLRAQPDAADIRRRQARLVRHWTRDIVARGGNLIILGDINTEETSASTKPEGDLGTLRGLDTPDDDDDLVDLFRLARDGSQPTHLSHKQFDHVLVTPGLLKPAAGQPGYVARSLTVRKDLVVRGRRQDENHQDEFWRIPQAERDVSDHYPVVAEFELRP